MPRASGPGFKAQDNNVEGLQSDASGPEMSGRYFTDPNEPCKVAWLKPHLNPVAHVLLFKRYGMLLSNTGEVQCLPVLPGFHTELCKTSICVRALCSYGGAGCSAN